MERNHICKKCGGIAGWDSYFQSWICTRCGNNEPKPITNADRIRAMTDEELSVILAMQSEISPPWCTENDVCPYINQDPARCDLCALDWLQKEVNTDGQ